MANLNQEKIIRQGVKTWNTWRQDHPKVKIDLSGINLENVNLNGINLSKANIRNAEFKDTSLVDANLTEAQISRAYFYNADLSGSIFSGNSMREVIFNHANLTGASLRILSYNCSFCNSNLLSSDLQRSWFFNPDFSKANLTEANLRSSVLRSANFTDTNLSNSDFTNVDLQGSNFVKTIITGAIFSNCRIYGTSVWSLIGKPKIQSNLIINPEPESSISIDDIQMAQFVYLLLNRDNLTDLLNTLSSKIVLILGRFTQKRKEILDALAEELKKCDLLPIIFDFDKPTSLDFTETIKTLAGISLFVIADITNPKSSPLELQATVPDYQIPFVTIIQEGEEPFSMFRDLSKYDWILQPISYDSKKTLIMSFKDSILERALEKRNELSKKKAYSPAILSAKDFLPRKQNAR